MKRRHSRGLNGSSQLRPACSGGVVRGRVAGPERTVPICGRRQPGPARFNGLAYGLFAYALRRSSAVQRSGEHRGRNGGALGDGGGATGSRPGGDSARCAARGPPRVARRRDRLRPVARRFHARNMRVREGRLFVFEWVLAEWDIPTGGICFISTCRWAAPAPGIRDSRWRGWKPRSGTASTCSSS